MDKLNKNFITLAIIFTVVVFGAFFATKTFAANSPTILKITGGGCCGLWPANLTNSGGTLFFTDYDSTHGTELWKTDGTESGTVMVKDINPGSNDGEESNLTDIYGTLYFSATDGVNGSELWKSDGTADGTIMVKDINPGSGDSDIWHIINVNGNIYFSADDGVHGAELWESDGTQDGTVMVKDLNPGSDSSSPQNLTYCNGLVYFTAQPGAMMGSMIYKTDGTDDGTVALALPGMATPNSLFCAGSTLYYTANNVGGNTGVELGKTDGTDDGTVLVKDINPGGDSSYPENFADINGELYFRATDGMHGEELWESDGTSDGTTMIKDINPGSGDSSPAQFFNNGDGYVYFDASDGPHGEELWKTDGTSDGTVMVKDINENNGDSWPGDFTNIYGTIYFDATNVSGGKGGNTKYQLWKTNGTESGTTAVADLNPGGDDSVGSLTNINNTLYFTADDGVNGTQLWSYIPPSPPIASNVFINGIANVGQTVTGQYTYSDNDSSPEGTSTYRWLRDGVPIPGATSLTYLVVSDDLGTSITFEVTPVAQNGMIGTATQSNDQSVSVPTFITITAPTKTSTTSITDTTIQVTNDLGIMASDISLDVYSTVDTSALVCAQTNSKTVDCTIQVDSSGDLIIHTMDILGHPATQTENGYSITPPAPTNSPSWYDNNWKHRKEIIIDHTKVFGSDQLNFPVLINTTDSGLQAYAQSDGHDILFTDSTGTNKIPYEREQYTSSTGALVVWVKIANLSHTTDTFIYMYYGNSTAGDQQDSTGGVWDSNFIGVWHSEDASSTTIADSTANANTGTKYGIVKPIETPGKIGEAQSYNGVDNYIGVVPAGTLTGSFTVSVWAKVPDNENSHTVIGTRNDGDNSFDFKFDTGHNIHGDIGDGSEWMTTGADVDTGIFSYLTNTWYKITYAVTGDGYSIYVNGIDVKDGTYDTPGVPMLFDLSHNLFIGQVGYGIPDDNNNDSGEWFKGAIDEVRVSNIARSADWIKTEYNNEDNPSTFYRLGSQTNLAVDVGGGGGSSGGGLVIPMPPPAPISPLSSIPTPICKFADIDCDGPIGELDFSILMSQWGQTGPLLSADLNKDGIVDELDFSILMANWGL